MTWTAVCFLLACFLSAVAASPASEVRHSSISSSENVDASDYFKFYVHTIEVPEGIEFVLDPLSGYIIKETPTKIITHGHLSNKQQIMSLVYEYVKNPDETVNVISFDWEQVAMQSSELVAGGEALCLGKYMVGDFIDILGTHYNIAPDKIHLIGYNMGAHLMGAAGRSHNSKHPDSPKCGRITGLDPMGTYFEPRYNSLTALSHSDATFVDIFHTDAGDSGIKAALGTADFYPNGGASQPACKVRSRKNCDSHMSIDYFVESIKIDNSFQGRECASWDDFNSFKCNNNPVVVAGEFGNLNASGTYYYWTYGKRHYGAQEKGVSVGDLSMTFSL